MAARRILQVPSPTTLVLAVCLAGDPAAHAGSPHLQRLEPCGGRRGTTVDVGLHGARLGDPRDILFYRPGVTVQELRSVSDAHAIGTLAISEDCPTGLLPLRLVTAAGITELKLFEVGNCPEIAESEPNGDRNQPQPITLPVTVNGTVTREDIDYFSFQVAAGQRLNFEVVGMRLGETVFDPHLSLLDPRGAVLAGADDTRLVGQDAVISHQFAQGGSYLLAVREASYLGSGASRYRLHAGTFPRPQGVFPPGGEIGRPIEVQWLADSQLGIETLALPTEPGTDFAIHATDEHGVCPSAVPFRLAALRQVVEVEPNDGRDNATGGTVPGAFSGRLERAGDLDVFSFPASKGRKLVIDVFARRLGSPLDSVISVYNPAGTRISANDDAGRPDSRVNLTVPEDGRYTLHVRDLLDRGGELFTYRIEVVEAAPVLTLSTPPTQQHLTVPQGNANAVVLRVRRQRFGGPLKLQLGDLPAGLTLLGDTVPHNVSSIPLVLQAAPQAELSAALTDIRAAHADPNQPVAGRLRQDIRLTDFEDRTMCAQTVTRFPIAVTESVPFAITVAKPQVAMVRRGHLDLNIAVQRAEGFTQPVELRMLWNPPGVGSGSATVAGDKQSAAIRINAGADAAPGDWPLVVIGSADVGGRVQVCSQPAQLGVSEPPVLLTPQRTRITQGRQAEMIVAVERKLEFSGQLPLELRGLPRGVTAGPTHIGPESAEARFVLVASADAAVGRHGGVHALASLENTRHDGRFVSPHGLLIVDRPLPPKKAQAAARPAPPPAPGVPKGRVRHPRRPEFQREVDTP